MKLTGILAGLILLPAAGLWISPKIYSQQTATSSPSPTTAASQPSPKVTPRGADTWAAFDKLSRQGMRVVMLGHDYQLLVPSEMRFRPVDGRKLIEAVAARGGLHVVWIHEGRTAVIQRGATDPEVKRIVEGLKSVDVERRRESAQIGGSLKDVRVVEALTASCLDKDAETVKLAVESLNQLGMDAVAAIQGEKALALLEKLAADEDIYVRKNAVFALGQVGGQKALALLEKLAGDENRGVRMDAVIALGHVGGEKAFLLLEKLAGDKDSGVRAFAAGALGHVGGEKAFLLLEKLAGDKDSGVRAFAAGALGDVGGQKALALLEKLAGDEDAGVCASAVYALGEVGGEKALALLEKLAGDENKEVRGCAAYALGVVGGEKALALLEKLAEDTDAGVRRSVAYALGVVGDEKALALLEKLAGDENKEVRGCVAYALGQVDSKKAFALLEKLAGDADEPVRQKAAEALRIVGDEKAFALLEKLAEDLSVNVRYAVALALREVGGEKALASLEKLAADVDANVRVDAANYLGHMDGETVLAILERLLDSPYEDVRERAAERIQTRNLDRRFSLVMRTAVGMLGSTDQSLQGQMAEHIRRLEDGDFKVREKAQQAIKENFAAAEPLLQKTLKSSEIGTETKIRLKELMDEKMLVLRAIKFVRDNKLLEDAGYLKELLKSTQGEDKARVERRLKEIEAKPATAPAAAGKNSLPTTKASE
ncbi:MAG: HEAT repeat domain-containing protein [Planctomycetes bacterium]|nr:HEAT repeat domain-containing protein [Planctomycetota bacterium]